AAAVPHLLSRMFGARCAEPCSTAGRSRPTPAARQRASRLNEGDKMIRTEQYNIKFPITPPHELAQDEAYCHLVEGGEERKIRFHEYGEIYKRPGLYEQLFYQRLKCNSPRKVAD